MSFLRHREIYQVEASWRGRNRGPARTIRLDESPVGYSLAGCSPAEPASASPTGGTLQQWRGDLQLANSLLSVYHLISWSHFRGAPQICVTTWLKPVANEIRFASTDHCRCNGQLDFFLRVD
jgi:hypothetical protein